MLKFCCSRYRAYRRLQGHRTGNRISTYWKNSSYFCLLVEFSVSLPSSSEALKSSTAISWLILQPWVMSYLYGYVAPYTITLLLATVSSNLKLLIVLELSDKSTLRTKSFARIVYRSLSNNHAMLQSSLTTHRYTFRDSFYQPQNSWLKRWQQFHALSDRWPSVRPHHRFQPSKPRPLAVYPPLVYLVGLIRCGSYVLPTRCESEGINFMVLHLNKYIPRYALQSGITLFTIQMVSRFLIHVSHIHRGVWQWETRVSFHALNVQWSRFLGLAEEQDFLRKSTESKRL